MKNLYQSFKVLIQVIFLIAFGFYALAFSLNIDSVLKPIDFLYGTPRGRLIVMVVGALSILASIIMILAQSKASSENRAISFENPSGNVKISLTAIEDFIRKVALQIPGIHDLKPMGVVRKNKIIVNTKVTVWGSENLLNISSKAQEAIKSYLQEILGGDEKIEINMHVVKVLQDASKLKAAEPAETPTE